MNSHYTNQVFLWFLNANISFFIVPLWYRLNLFICFGWGGGCSKLKDQIIMKLTNKSVKIITAYSLNRSVSVIQLTSVCSQQLSQNALYWEVKIYYYITKNKKQKKTQNTKNQIFKQDMQTVGRKNSPPLQSETMNKTQGAVQWRQEEIKESSFTSYYIQQNLWKLRWAWDVKCIAT